jgi:hypothetical protein
MALDDSAVVIPGTGHVYVAPAGTPKPSNLITPEPPWQEMGHTSIDDGLTITRDGGDSEVLGTWQNPSLRERRDPVVFAVTLHLLQIDNNTLSLYFGGGDASEAGVFGVNLISQPQERAMFVRIVDGDNEFPFYIPKASIASDDDVEADVEEFLAWPIRATVLGVSGSNLMEFYGEQLGPQANEVQRIAITGAPTGGGFTLTYDGETTATIAYNAAASAVQSALEALSNIVPGDVSCSGGALPSSPVDVTFGGHLGDQDVEQMTASASLTGGTSPAVTVTTTTPGQ